MPSSTDQVGTGREDCGALTVKSRINQMIVTLHDYMSLNANEVIDTNGQILYSSESHFLGMQLKIF